MSNQHTWSISDAKTNNGETMIVGGPGQEFGLIAVVTDEADAKQIIADREARADAPSSVSHSSEATRLADRIMARDLQWLPDGPYLSDDDSMLISAALRAWLAPPSAATTIEVAAKSLPKSNCLHSDSVRCSQCADPIPSPEPSRATASSAEPVAYVPFHEERGYLLSLAVQPDQFHAHPSFRPLYATPPSSGNADAVRQELHGKMNCLVGIALSSTNGFTYLNDHARKLLNQAAAALSSAPVAGEIELKVEQGGAGLWYATSDQIPGLLVAEQTHGLALNKVGHMLWNMQKARLLSRHDRQDGEPRS